MEAVTAGLVDAGRDVSIIDVGPDIFHVLERRRSELDLVFNNAEGPEEGELRTGSSRRIRRRAHRPNVVPGTLRLVSGELVIDVRGDSMTMRGPAEYLRPFALEWGEQKVPLKSSLDAPSMRMSPAGWRAGAGRWP